MNELRIFERKYMPQKESVLADAIIHIVIGLSALLTVYPFIYIFSMSISDPIEAASDTVWLLPIGLSLKSYAFILGSGQIWRAFANSIFFTATITLLNVANSVMVGYALTKKGLLGRKFIILYLLIPMFFSGGLIPTFIIVQKLGLFNSILAIIIPSIYSMWNIILARTYINTIPVELKESAFIDGAGENRILVSIILPLAKPIIAVLVLYTAIAVWNGWFYYLIFLPGKPEWHPLQLFLTKALLWGELSQTLDATGSMNPEMMKDKLLNAAIGVQMKYTVIMVSTIPIIILYPFVQKHFIKGALIGSLKE